MPTSKSIFTPCSAFTGPVTIKFGSNTVTLVEPAKFNHDVDDFTPFYVKSDPQGFAAILFLAHDAQFEIVA